MSACVFLVWCVSHLYDISLIFHLTVCLSHDHQYDHVVPTHYRGTLLFDHSILSSCNINFRIFFPWSSGMIIELMYNCGKLCLYGSWDSIFWFNPRQLSTTVVRSHSCGIDRLMSYLPDILDFASSDWFTYKYPKTHHTHITIPSYLQIRSHRKCHKFMEHQHPQLRILVCPLENKSQQNTMLNQEKTSTTTFILSQNHFEHALTKK